MEVEGCVEDEVNDLLQLVDQRMRALEQQVYGQSHNHKQQLLQQTTPAAPAQPSPPSSPSSPTSISTVTLSDSASDVQHQLAALLHNHQWFGEFFSLYDAVQPILLLPMLQRDATATATSTTTSPAGLSLEAKQTLLISRQDELLRMCSLLEKLDSLQKFINSENIFNLPTSCSARLPKLQKCHLDQADETNLLEDQMRSLITSYNCTISLLSKKFVLYDELLSNLEYSLKKSEDVRID